MARITEGHMHYMEPQRTPRTAEQIRDALRLALEYFTLQFSDVSATVIMIHPDDYAVLGPYVHDPLTALIVRSYAQAPGMLWIGYPPSEQVESLRLMEIKYWETKRQKRLQSAQ